MAPPTIPADFDFLDPDVNQEGLPVKELAELRKTEPIHWVDVPGGTGGFGDKGYWLVTKHADVKEVSRRSDVFSSWQNGAIPVWPKEMQFEQIELQILEKISEDALNQAAATLVTIKETLLELAGGEGEGLGSDPEFLT